MAWRVFAEQMFTADYSGSPTHSAKAVMDYDLALKAVRTWVVMFNSPVFTQLQMRIYSNSGGYPLDLLHTFTKTWTLAEITSQPYAVREIYFDTTNAFPLIGGETYHFVLWATGYTGTASSHIGWVRTLDDPPYPGFTPEMTDLGIAPFRITYIGAKA